MKRLVTLTLATMLFGLLFAGEALAAPQDPHLNWGSHVNAGAVQGGQLVINITHKVLNDQDSAVTRPVWALDNYNKSLQVWQVGPNSFYAVARYTGSFTTTAGSSPMGRDPDGIAGGIKGSYEGGYTSTVFTGTLRANPEFATRGNIGTFDYSVAPFDWVDSYFESTNGFDLAWWGWVYRAGKNGTWVNSIDGNYGDIVD